jgi:signal peptide peptidase SppA
MGEPIFKGVFRSFCTAIAVILGLAAGVGITLMAISAILGPQYLPPPSEPTIMPDAQGERSVLSGRSPAILRLDFHGVIGMGDLVSSKIENILIDSREAFLKGDRVKAILLHINTPGGAADDADTIYRALMQYKAKYKVPIYAYVEGLCASGGMYIASAADQIYASPSSVIGSVGVRMGPNFNFSETMTKVGVTSLTLTEGKDKDALNPFRPWKPDEDANLRPIMASLYQRFVAIVTAARPHLTKEKLVSDYGAHVYIAQEAQKLGYIDFADTDYSQTVAALAEAAQIKEAYQVVLLSPPQPFLGGLAQSLAPKKFLQSLNLSGKFLYLYEP